MAKGIYVGIGGVAKKVVKIYGGIASAVKKVIKVYVGVGGVAKPCWLSEGIEYYGTTPTGLPAGTNNIGGTKVGNYAIFGGGSTSGGFIDTVTTYNTSLTRGSATGLKAGSYGVGKPAATSISNSYALFAGGQVTDSYNIDVITYSTSLTRSVLSTTDIGEFGHGVASIGGYGLIGGGYGSTGGAVGAVCYWNTSLVKNSVSLSEGKYDMGAGNNANYAIFGGGSKNSGNSYTVDAYNSSMTRTACADSSVGGYGGGAGNSNYVLISGGWSTTISAYDNSLTKTNTTASVARSCKGLTTPEFAILTGGRSSDTLTYYGIVDAFSTSLTRFNPTAWSPATESPGLALVGNYALAAGGYTRTSTYETKVHAYVISS